MQKVAFKKPIMALKFDEMDPCTNVCVAMNMRERERRVFYRLNKAHSAP